MKYNMKFLTSDMHSTWGCASSTPQVYASLGHSKWDNSFCPDFLSFYSLLPLTITMNLIISTTHSCKRKQSRLTASECPHPGAVKHIHTISIPLNRATLALCLLLHKSSTFPIVLCITTVCIVCWCTVPVDDAAEIFRVFRIIMVKWCSRVQRGVGRLQREVGRGRETIVSFEVALFTWS